MRAKRVTAVILLGLVVGCAVHALYFIWTGRRVLHPDHYYENELPWLIFLFALTRLPLWVFGVGAVWLARLCILEGWLTRRGGGSADNREL